MSYDGNTNRWWENYLVRYFMPSIASIAIIAWLASVAVDGTRSLLFFNILGEKHDTTSLILLILYANLFCYISSYPILGFHATRVIDFLSAHWKHNVLDRYILSLILAVVTVIVVYELSSVAFFASFVLVFLYSAAQLWRLKRALKEQRIDGLEGSTSLAYGYAYSSSGPYVFCCSDCSSGRKASSIRRIRIHQVNLKSLHSGHTWEWSMGPFCLTVQRPET